jgi:hypothetical protein
MFMLKRKKRRKKNREKGGKGKNSEFSRRLIIFLAMGHNVSWHCHQRVPLAALPWQLSAPSTLS